MDAVLEKAVDLARAAAVEVADGAEWVGDHLTASTDSDRLVTHLFACALPGYRGWVWSVTLSRAPRGKEAAVCEAHLVAADDALLSPPWVPWAERVQPGDIKPGMAVPRFDPDPRLQPGYTVTDSDAADALAIWELGLGRERVLGPVGRDEAAERWTARTQDVGSESRDGSSPTEAVGEFVIPLSGSMRLHFGVCANKWCPFDGTVVPVDHACDGQQQAAPERTSTLWPVNDPVFETDAAVALDLSIPDSNAEPAPEQPAAAGEKPAESGQDADGSRDATVDAGNGEAAADARAASDGGAASAEGATPDEATPDEAPADAEDAPGAEAAVDATQPESDAEGDAAARAGEVPGSAAAPDAPEVEQGGQS